ncbi:MAG: hypothetical protein HYY84_09135 [Deltaproteobacteria bacterium]|nr:hypothetical protein [Deltaproteobacteria bacterium]
MHDKKKTEAGIPTTTRDEYLKFDGTKLGLRDYADDEVRAFNKAREGLVPVVEGLIDLLPKFEGRVPVKGVDPVSLGKTLERYQELTRAAAQVEKIYEMVRETRLAVCDELMNDIYRVYRVASAIGRDDKEVHGEIDFVRDWLSNGPRPTSAHTNTTPTANTANR